VRKGLVRGGIVIFAVLLVITFLEVSERWNSYDSPEEALLNEDRPALPVEEIISTEYYEQTGAAYVIFYSQVEEPKDYVAVAAIEQNRNGWRFIDIGGVGYADNPNPGSFIGLDNRYYSGLAEAEVAQVRVGEHEIGTLELEGSDSSVWLLDNIDKDDLNGEELEFFDEDGELLDSYPF
jgi:hypothetical protein